MALQHDSQGFLIGEVIPEIRRAAELLERIRNDVADIKRSFLASAQGDSGSQPPILPPLSGETAVPGSGRQTQGDSGSQPPILPPLSGETAVPGSGRQTQGDSGSPAPILPPLSGETVGPGRRRNRPAAGSQVPPGHNRDARGRFTNNNPNPDEEERKQKRLFNGMADRLADAVTGSAAGLEEADPTIKAINEVAQPLAQGYQFFAGDDCKENKWYRRLFGELRLFRKEQTVFDRTEQRVLREIDENTENAQGSGSARSGGFLGGLLGGVAGRILPLLMTALGFIFGPVGLALAGAATAAWGVFTEDGRKFFANAADSFEVGWEATTGYIKGKWDEGVKFFTDIWAPVSQFFADKFGIVSESAKAVVGKVSDTANQANAFVKDQTGVDVKEKAKTASATVKTAYQKTVEAASRNVIEPAANAVGKAKDWVLGQTSQFFESGKGGAGTVSTGKGDFGGASYGTYQLSSKQGTLQNFLKASGYENQFEGLAPGTAEFNRRWKEIAQQDPAFGTAQHAFIKQTHFDPQMARLKQAGIDIAGRGKAVQDAVWSTSVQFGGDTALIERALKGKDQAKLSDADFVSALQDYKIANNDRLFSKSSNQVRVGTLNRARNEKTQLLSLAAIESKIAPIVQTPAVQTVSAPSPSMPAMPKPPVIAEAPQVMMPVVSDGLRKSLSININKDDIGQDISDRRLAHIVTGGLS
ncbi:hypothetical protein, partial [Candidatus Methylomicrobium oryzae]|uniref:VgrG-related protein n=1 Tax=Candidatus Methylomicrobium oryzae TaxID=2802053 RepID=UPI001923600A